MGPLAFVGCMMMMVTMMITMIIIVIIIISSSVTGSDIARNFAPLTVDRCTKSEIPYTTDYYYFNIMCYNLIPGPAYMILNVVLYSSLFSRSRPVFTVWLKIIIIFLTFLHVHNNLYVEHHNSL